MAGSAWESKSDGELIDYVSDPAHEPIYHAAPLIEMQRRLMIAVRAASDAADKQAAEVISLTRALKVYTIVLAGIGIVQIALMLWK